MTTIYDFLPHQLLSSIANRLARTQKPFIKNPFIQWFSGHYGVDMTDAVIQDPTEFACFHDFFTRELRPGARPIVPGQRSIASPADGVISAKGAIKKNTLLQAKGRYYSLRQLLTDESWAAQFEQGSFFTVYLSPKDYHRVHMPLAGSLLSMRYIPGRLFPVNAKSTRKVDQLFTRNERLVCYFQTEFGPMAVVFVGALLVGQMGTTWHGTVNARRENKIQDWHYDGKRHFEKGDEIGHFSMGSTAIVLLPSANLQWGDESPTTVQMGQGVAEFLSG